MKIFMYVRLFFLSSVLFVFLIDSGGPLGLRPLTLAFCLAGAFYYTLKIIKRLRSDSYYHVEIENYLFISLFYIFLVYGFLTSVVNGIPLPGISPWLVPVSFLIVFYLFFNLFEPRVVGAAYVMSGVLFGVVILIVFTLALLLPPSLVKLVFLYFSDFPGWFYLKESGFIPNYPNVYFQATLSFVPLCLFSYFYGFKKCAAFFLFILLICLSRFGIFTCVAFICLYHGLERIVVSGRSVSSKSLFIFSSFLGPIVILLFMFLGLYYQQYYLNDGSGLMIRLGHIVSLFESMSLNSFLFGTGAGSYYYSSGFDNLVDNVEISQLELLRKYGFVGFSLFHISFLYVIYSLINKTGLKLPFVLLSFYFVSLSNPVLITFSLSIIIAFSLSYTRKDII